jgi:hypothetical protein
MKRTEDEDFLPAAVSDEQAVVCCSYPLIEKGARRACAYEL